MGPMGTVVPMRRMEKQVPMEPMGTRCYTMIVGWNLAPMGVSVPMRRMGTRR